LCPHHQPLPQVLPSALAEELGVGLPAGGRDEMLEDAYACSSGSILMILNLTRISGAAAAQTERGTPAPRCVWPRGSWISLTGITAGPMHNDLLAAILPCGRDFKLPPCPRSSPKGAASPLLSHRMYHGRGII